MIMNHNCKLIDEMYKCMKIIKNDMDFDQFDTDHEI